MLTSTSEQRLHQAWAALVEQHGWSIEKIASIWMLPVAHVEAIIDQLSMQPLPQPRRVYILPHTKEAAQKRRDILWLLHKQGRTLEELAQQFPDYSLTVLQRILTQPLETEQGRAFVAAHPFDPGHAETKALIKSLYQRGWPLWKLAERCTVFSRSEIEEIATSEVVTPVYAKRGRPTKAKHGPQPKPIQRLCRCGKKLRGNGKRQYCSDTCRQKARRERTRSG